MSNSDSNNNAPAAASAPAVPRSKRKPALLAVAGPTLLAGIAYGAYWGIYLRHYEATDNAYVQAPMVLVTPQVGGTVLQILADDTDVVKAGQPLVRLDPDRRAAGAGARAGATRVAQVAAAQIDRGLARRHVLVDHQIRVGDDEIAVEEAEQRALLCGAEARHRVTQDIAATPSIGLAQTASRPPRRGWWRPRARRLPRPPAGGR